MRDPGNRFYNDPAGKVSDTAKAIPVIDLDLGPKSGGWSSALSNHVDLAQKLLGAFKEEAERQASTFFAGRLFLALTKFAANWLNKRMGKHYRKEIEELAKLLGVSVSDVLIANCAYDLANSGCSTFVQTLHTGGTLHARNLDWEFPQGLLKTCVSITRVSNSKHGPYSIVTWPGLFGVLTGVAKSRFAITINYVCHAEESKWIGLAVRALKGYWPVTWLVRRVFDEAGDYTSAVEMLRREPVLSPVLFTISGPHAKEGVVVERASKHAEIRPMTNGSVFVTNHYVSQRLKRMDAGEDMLKSNERFEFLKRELISHPIGNSKDSFKLLSQEPLRNPKTQYHAAMSAGDGWLEVSVPGGSVTRVPSLNGPYNVEDKGG